MAVPLTSGRLSMAQIQRIPETQKAIAGGAKGVQSAQPKPELVEMRIEISKQRHSLVYRPEIHLNEHGPNRSAREHLSCALEDALFRTFHVDLQNIDIGYPMRPAKVINRVCLNFDCLAGVRLSP